MTIRDAIQTTADEPTELTVERCTDPDEWDDFVVGHDGSPLARWAWGAAIASYGFDRHYLAATEDGAIRGVLPLVHVDSRLFGDVLVSLPYTSHGELLVDDRRPDATERHLLAAARRLGDSLDVDAVTIRGTELGDRPEFTRRTDYVSFHVPTLDADAAWENLRGSRRRQVEQARDDDALEYAVGETLSDLRDFYRLYLQSMHGHGTPPHSFAFFREFWEAAPDDAIHLGLVRLDGEPINAVLNVALGSTVVQKSVVLDYDHRDRQGGSLLSWKSIEWACERDYDYYDLGRTRRDTGVHQFKKSWGGDEVELVDYHYFPNGPVDLPDAEDGQYDLPKRVWRKLPLPVTRLVGPYVRKGITL